MWKSMEFLSVQKSMSTKIKELPLENTSGLEFEFCN